MITEEKQLLLKDLCARLPYGVKVQIISRHPVILGDGSESDELDEPYNISLTIDDHNSLEDFFYEDWVIDIKPYLRPMSSMTEEEIKELKHLIAFSGSPDGAANLVDWLNKKMFAYRNIDGKDMFKLGLALEAPENMYKEK